MGCTDEKMGLGPIAHGLVTLMWAMTFPWEASEQLSNETDLSFKTPHLDDARGEAQKLKSGAS